MSELIVKPGDMVRASFSGKILYAIVLSVLPKTNEDLLGADDEPALTVAVPNGNIEALGTPDFHRGFTRMTPVLHGSHDHVAQGSTGIFWLDVLPDASEEVSLPHSDSAIKHSEFSQNGEEDEQLATLTLATPLSERKPFLPASNDLTSAKRLTNGRYIDPKGAEPGEVVQTDDAGSTAMKPRISDTNELTPFSAGSEQVPQGGLPLHTKTMVDAYQKKTVVEENPSTEVLATNEIGDGDNVQVPVHHDPDAPKDYEAEPVTAQQSLGTTSAPSANVALAETPLDDVVGPIAPGEAPEHSPALDPDAANEPRRSAVPTE